MDKSEHKLTNQNNFTNRLTSRTQAATNRN